MPSAYDMVVAPLDAAGLGRLRARLTEGVAGDVVEIGVGTGRQLRHYPPGARVTGVDPDAAAIARAARRAPDARLLPGSAEALPLPDASMDWAVSALVLCTVADPARALAEIRRVLRPGGRLRALEHVRSPIATLARAQGMLNPLWGRLAGGCRLDRPTAELVATAGLRVERRDVHLGGHLVLLEAVRPD